MRRWLTSVACGLAMGVVVAALTFPSLGRLAAAARAALPPGWSIVSQYSDPGDLGTGRRAQAAITAEPETLAADGAAAMTDICPGTAPQEYPGGWAVQCSSRSTTTSATQLAGVPRSTLTISVVRTWQWAIWPVFAGIGTALAAGLVTSRLRSRR